MPLMFDDLPSSSPTQGQPLMFDDLPQSSAGKGLAYNAADAVVGTGKGLVQGVEGLAGLPGDVQKGMNKLSIPDSVINWARSKMGKAPITPEQSAQVDQALKKQTLPTSAGISQYGSDNLPDAQTGLGQNLQYVSSFLPQAAAGPESLVKNLLMRGVLPGVASDALGAAGDTINPTLGTAGRVIGSLVQRGGGAAREAAQEAVTPTNAALEAAGGAGRDAFRSQPFMTTHGTMSDWATRQLQDFDTNGKGLTAPHTPETSKLLYGRATDPTPMTGDELDGLHYQLGQIAENGQGRDALAARIAQKSLEDRFTSFSNNQALVGNPKLLAQTWQDAQGNLSAMYRDRDISQVMDSAQIKSLTENSGLGGGNRMKKGVANYLANDDNLRGWTQPEKDNLLAMAKGNTFQNAKRFVSNYLGGGGGVGSAVVGHLIGGAAGTAAGAATDGPTGGAFGGLAGTGMSTLLGVLARRSYNKDVARTGADMSRMLRSRSPMGVGMPLPPASVSPVVQRLLALHQAAMQ